MKTVMGIAMLCVACWTVWKKFALGREVEQSLGWPRAQGEVTRSSISLEDSSTSWDNPQKTYKANIQYEYSVGRKQYCGNKICIGGQLQLSLKGKADRYCAEYPVGRAVVVYYNPDNPAVAVLERREETSWFYLVGGAVMAIVGFLFLTGR